MSALRRLAPLALCIAFASSSFAQVDVPATARKVVLEKADKGYRWQLMQAPVPALGDDQVLVRVRAVALNRGDLELLASNDSGPYAGRVPASDAAGDVVAVGRNVKGLRKGARVTSLYFRNWTDGPPSKEAMGVAHGFDVDGVLADYVVLEAPAVAPMPAGLTYEEASTLPTAGLTGWMAVNGHRTLRKGDVVLVQGTGGVSVFALQFAHAAGARVIVTSGSDEKLQKVQSLGASAGINYRTVPAWSARVLTLTDGHGADVIVDVGGKSTLEQSVLSLAYHGQVSVVGGLTGYDGTIPALGLLLKTAKAQGIYVGSRADLLRMNAFILTHRLKPVIDRVYALEEYAAALRHMESGNFVGKIVLRL